jgi:hypothetical protein
VEPTGDAEIDELLWQQENCGPMPADFYVKTEEFWKDGTYWRYPSEQERLSRWLWGPVRQLQSLAVKSDWRRSRPAAEGLVRLVSDPDPWVQRNKERVLGSIIYAGATGRDSSVQLPGDFWQQLLAGKAHPVVQWCAQDLLAAIEKPEKEFRVSAVPLGHIIHVSAWQQTVLQFMQQRTWPVWNFPDGDSLRDFVGRVQLALPRVAALKPGQVSEKLWSWLRSPDEELPLFAFVLQDGHWRQWEGLRPLGRYSGEWWHGEEFRELPLEQMLKAAGEAFAVGSALDVVYDSIKFTGHALRLFSP